MPSYEIEVLGPPRILLDGHPIEHLRKKTLALLTYLLVEDRPIGRDTLATLLWPGSGQSAARRNLRTCLSCARSVLCPQVFQSTADCIALDTSACDSDYHRLRRFDLLSKKRLLEAVLAPENRKCLRGGGFLEGFTLPDCPEFDVWELRTGDEIRELRSRILRSAFEYAEDSGRMEEAAGLIEALISCDPLDEPAYRLAMEVHAASGNWCLAERYFQRCTEILEEEFGEGPEEETLELMRRIRIRDPDITRDAYPPLSRMSPARPPREQNRIFGRDTTRDHLLELLRQSRTNLVTLTGAAGSGKTRLAVHICNLVISSYPDGIVFTDLTSVERSSDVLRTLASALGIRERSDHGEGYLGILAEQLDGRRMLIVLDNFEHVLDAAGEIGVLLSRVRDIQILVTSREPLKLQGENVIEVPPLLLPDSDETAVILESPAVRLLLDRTSCENIPLHLDPSNLTALRSIVRLLDGLPLALELVVPWFRAYTPVTIAEKLNGTGPVRTRLTAQGRAHSSRHRSLAAAFEGSYNRLSREEKRFFAELSAFSNGYDSSAVEAVFSPRIPDEDIHYLFCSLIEKNLVRKQEWGSIYTFGMLESVREYSANKLESVFHGSDIQRCHAEYYAQAAPRYTRRLSGPEQISALDTLKAMHSNVITALNYFLEEAAGSSHAADAGLSLATDLVWYWYLSNNFSLGRKWIEEFSNLSTDTDLEPRAYFGRGLLTFFLGEWRRATGDLEECLRLCEDNLEVEVLAYSYLGVASRWLGESERGWRCHEKAVAAARKASRNVLVYALVFATCTCGGDFPGDPPVEDMHEALDRAVSIGDFWSIAHIYNGFGDLYSALGDAENSLSSYLESVSRFESLGDRYMIGWNYEGLGRLGLRMGNLGDALSWTMRALAAFDGIGDELNCALMMARLAGIGGPDSGRISGRIAGAALTILSRLRQDDLTGAPQIKDALDTIELLQRKEPAAFETGRSLTRAEAVALTGKLNPVPAL